MDAGRETGIPVALESDLPTLSNENQAWATNPKSWALPCTLQLEKHPDCEFAQLVFLVRSPGGWRPEDIRRGQT